MSPVRPPHIGEIYRRQKQRSFHGTVPNGGLEIVAAPSDAGSVNGADQQQQQQRPLSGDLESTVDKLRSLLEQKQRQNSSTESKSSSTEQAQSLSLQARYFIISVKRHLQGVSGFVRYLTPPLTLDRVVQSLCPLRW